jgi:LmeA-like phospholipid-binding
VSQYPTAPMPIQSRVPESRRRRWWLVVVIVLVVLLGVLVIGDRVAKAYTENRIAQQIQTQGFNGTKPNVSISGFPFLTQLASRDFHNVDISADKLDEGPVQIRNLNATLQNVRINKSFNGGTVEHLTGTGLITFAGLANAAGGQSVSVSAAGGDEVKISVDLGVVSGTAIARVTQVGNKISVHIVSADGLPADFLGQLGDFSLSVPQLPLGMSIQNVTVSAQGVVIHVIGNNVTFSQ